MKLLARLLSSLLRSWMKRLLDVLFRLLALRPATPRPPSLKQTDPKRSCRDAEDRSSSSRNSVTEVGQSSGGGPAEPVAYCGVCMEEKYAFDLFAITGCSHSYCARCVARYVASKVGENVVSIRCPDPRCKTGFLEPEACRLILPKKVYDQWGDRLCEAAVRDRAKTIYCPHQACSALLIIHERAADEEAITVAVCPHCSRLFCAQCRVPWHTWVACKEYQKLRRDERERLMLMNLAKAKKWQRCPKCKIFVEKTTGCNQIVCR